MAENPGPGLKTRARSGNARPRPLGHGRPTPLSAPAARSRLSAPAARSRPSAPVGPGPGAAQRKCAVSFTSRTEAFPSA